MFYHVFQVYLCLLFMCSLENGEQQGNTWWCLFCIRRSKMKGMCTAANDTKVSPMIPRCHF